MALAYAALANGGELLEPRLVREVRTRDGRVQASFERTVVRRVIPEDVAERLRAALVDVVEGGTGRQAALGPFVVAGKTGTARIAEGGRYVPGAYTASFAGFFPADDPQLVFLAKVDEPKGAYYGGATAAPITRTALEAALAAHHAPFDRRTIAAEPEPLPETPAIPAAALRHDAARTLEARGPFVLALDGSTSGQPDASRAEVTIPDVVDQPLRDAVRTLHAAGVRVQVDGAGVVGATWPAAGASVAKGSLVRVLARAGAR
jgi:membrane peptidoglycan carboxypeptidase